MGTEDWFSSLSLAFRGQFGVMKQGRMRKNRPMALVGEAVGRDMGFGEPDTCLSLGSGF
jgi:hypothetical protein